MPNWKYILQRRRSAHCKNVYLRNLGIKNVRVTQMFPLRRNSRIIERTTIFNALFRFHCQYMSLHMLSTKVKCVMW